MEIFGIKVHTNFKERGKEEQILGSQLMAAIIKELSRTLPF